jgi:hypothetical protein
MISEVVIWLRSLGDRFLWRRCRMGMCNSIHEFADLSFVRIMTRLAIQMRAERDSHRIAPETEQHGGDQHKPGPFQLHCGF